MSSHPPACDCARCERAAIYEHDAGLSREDAEKKAGLYIDELTALVVEAFDGVLGEWPMAQTESFA